MSRDFNSVPPGSHPGANAVTVEASAPAPTAVTATNSVLAVSDGPGRASVASDAGIAGPQDSISDPETSSLVPVDSARPSNVEAAPLFSSVDPGPCGIDFEVEVAALEAEWAARGISMNATTLRVVATNDSISKSISVAGE